MSYVRLKIFVICVLFSGMAIANHLQLPPPELVPLPEPTDTSVEQGQYKSVHLPISLHSAAIYPHNYLETNYSAPPIIPSPTLTPPSAMPIKSLTLKEAIYLALRSNPNVKIAEMQRIEDKYALEIAHREFEPKYTLTAFQTIAKGVGPVYGTDANMTVTTPLGTTYTADYQNDLSGNGGVATFSVTQPLLRGFNIKGLDWITALNNEEAAKLNFKDQVMTTVQLVIQDYRLLVGDYNNLFVQRRSLNDQEEEFRQDRVKLKYGKIAPSDLAQFEATLVGTRFSYVRQQSQTQTDYRTFLSSLGLIPNAVLHIDTTIVPPDYHIPTQDEAIQIALATNIQYQLLIIGLNQLKIRVRQAEDARKWTLNVTATKTQSDTGTGAVIPVNGTGGVTGPSDQSLTFNLAVPIDDVEDKSALVSARIAYEDAKLSLEQEKQTVIGTVITDLATIHFDQLQIKLQRQQVVLSQKTLDAAVLKYKFGKTTSFEVSTDQTNLLNSETTLISQEIQYMNDITALNVELGTMLEDWDIQLRY